MKGWRTELSSRKMLTVLFILLYCPFRLPFHFLTDHQIQILKKRNGERCPHFLFPRCSVLYPKYSTFRTFFHNNMEGSIGTITGIGHFASSTKTKQQKKKKKRYNLMTESLWSNNTSNRFKFIKTPTRRKNLWPLSLIWNNDYLLKQWLTQ